MKMRLILPFFLMFIISCGADSGNLQTDSEVNSAAIDSTYCDCHELTFDQPYNHFYRFERRKGFTGQCEEFYADGSVKISKEFTDGKLHGKVRSYFENGQLADEKEFDMNFQTGEQISYTQKGEVEYHALYKRGKQIKILVNKTGLSTEENWDTSN